MTDLLQRLSERKLAQWSLASLARALLKKAEISP